jgi:outer membrane murein-binding lipoprotein Lpp
MTKSKKSLIVGAAIAGLLAGGSAVQASNLLSSAKAGFNAAVQDKDEKSDKKAAKDKHACKGQNSCKGTGGCKSSDNGCKGKNSCKGKGGCRTDGKPMEEEKKPS